MGRRREHDRRPAVDQPVGIEFRRKQRHQHVGRAVAQAEHPAGQAEDMGEGRRDQHPVPGGEADGLRIDAQVRGEGLVGPHDALGRRRGARGETQDDRVVGSGRIGDRVVARAVDQGIEIEPCAAAADDDDVLKRRHPRLQTRHGRRRVVFFVAGGADHGAARDRGSSAVPSRRPGRACAGCTARRPSSPHRGRR